MSDCWLWFVAGIVVTVAVIVIAAYTAEWILAKDMEP